MTVLVSLHEYFQIYIVVMFVVDKSYLTDKLFVILPIPRLIFDKIKLLSECSKSWVDSLYYLS